MSDNEEEDSYFDIKKEQLPSDLPPKTITFIIDPTLTRIWNRIGYHDPEIAIETNNLAISLTHTYLEFMAQQSSKCDELNRQLYEHRKLFYKTKALYGDTTAKLDINDEMPLAEQESRTNKEVDNLNKKYAPRLALLKALHRKCKNHYDKLGIDEDDRGEFIAVGDTDYSQERVDRFKKMLATLKKEEANRVNIYRSCEKSIKSISDELEEPLSDQVVFIFANELVDTDSIQVLTKESEDLTALKIERYKDFDDLVHKIQHLYQILQIKQEDQIAIPARPTSAAMQELRSEHDYLQRTTNEIIEDLIYKFQAEIDEICDEMRVPDKLRPKYIGNNLDEKLDFVEKTVKVMRIRLAKTQPIIELLTKIEDIKQIPSPKTMKAQNPNISQQLLEQQTQERINRELPPLERQLIDLLIEFRYENGFDFQFEGVTYIDTLSQAYLAKDEDKFGKTVLDKKTPSPKKSPRQQELSSSPKRYTPKKSPYTPRKTRRLIDE